MAKPARLFKDKAMDAWVRAQLPPQLRAAPSTHSLYPSIVRSLVKDLRLHERSDWDSYHQGYASFLDCWFYRDTAAFRRPPYQSGEHRFNGLTVALCRAMPCFILGESEKSWGARGGAASMPTLGMIDVLPTPAVAELAERIAQHLERDGLVRLRRGDLDIPLPVGFALETNLSEGALKLFDALFYWYD